MLQLLPLLAACALQAPDPAEDEGTWRAFPLPALCLEQDTAAAVAPIELGRHLIEPGDGLAARPFGASPRLPVSTLLGLLQDEAERAGLDVSFQPTAPPLLAHGSAADLAVLERVIADVDRAGRDLEIRVRAWLTPGASDAGCRPDAAALRAATADRAPWAAARLLSGDTAVLGTRESRTFVRGYEVDIAADSGAADPVLGTALVGTTLHLTAARLDGGRRIHVEGLLDAAELLGIEDFDTDTFDLGVVQQPRLAVVQLAFSDVVENGAAIAVSFSGTPLSVPDRTLWLELSTATTSAPSGGWRAVDLALLERPSVDLPLPHPGTGLEDVDLGSEQRTLAEALPASAVAQAFARGAGRGTRARAIWSPGLLLAPAAEEDAWRQVEQLVGAAERSRSAAAELTLSRGALRAVLPVVEGAPARLLAGIETTLLSEYDPEVAPESWMARPVVGTVIDGVLVQGTLRSGVFRGLAWTAGSRPVSILGREQVLLGRLQLPYRAFRAARCALGGGSEAEILLYAEGEDPPLSAMLRWR